MQGDTKLGTKTYGGHTIEDLAARWEQLRTESVKKFMEADGVTTEAELQPLSISIAMTVAWDELAKEAGRFVLDYPTKDRILEIVSELHPTNSDVDAMSAMLGDLLREGVAFDEGLLNPTG